MCKIHTTFTGEKGLGVEKHNMHVEMWVYTFHEVLVDDSHIFGATLSF